MVVSTIACYGVRNWNRRREDAESATNLVGHNHVIEPLSHRFLTYYRRLLQDMFEPFDLDYF